MVAEMFVKVFLNGVVSEAYQVGRVFNNNESSTRRYYIFDVCNAAGFEVFLSVRYGQRMLKLQGFEWLLGESDPCHCTQSHFRPFMMFDPVHRLFVGSGVEIRHVSLFLSGYWKVPQDGFDGVQIVATLKSSHVKPCQ